MAKVAMTSAGELFTRGGHDAAESRGESMVMIIAHALQLQLPCPQPPPPPFPPPNFFLRGACAHPFWSLPQSGKT